MRSASHSALRSFSSASSRSTFQISAHRKITLLHCSLPLLTLCISLFRPHFFPTCPPPPFFFSSIISHLLWFKSSGLCLSACGSSKTNGSSLHLLLITPHPPSPFLSPTSPLPRRPLLLQPPFSSSPPPFFSPQHRKKMREREAGQLGVNRLMFWQFEIHP